METLHKTTLSPFFKCRKNTKLVKTKQGRMISFSKCLVCNSNISKFLKEQEARGVLSNKGIKTALSQILLLSYFFLKL